MNRSNPLLRRSRALIAAAALLVPAAFTPCSPARAQPAPAAARPAIDPATRDAAAQYWQAFALLPVGDAQQQSLAANWENVPLDPAAEKLIEASAGALKQLHRGSACERCDWGLNKEDSFGMLLPHLAKARDLGRLACLRARYRLAHAQGAGAVDDVVDTLVLARRVGADDVLIGIMVETGMEQMAVNAVAPHLPALSKDDLTALAARLAKLPRGGSLEGSVVWEREYGLMSLIGGLKDAKRDARPWEQFLAEIIGVKAETIRAAGGTPESVAEHLQALRPIYDEFPAALKLPQEQAHAKLAELRQRADSNPMKIALPDFTRAYDRFAATQTRLTLLRAAIAVIQGGPEQAKRFNDPFTGHPIEHRPTDGGFELASKVTDQGRPVTLVIGPPVK